MQSRCPSAGAVDRLTGRRPGALVDYSGSELRGRKDNGGGDPLVTRSAASRAASSTAHRRPAYPETASQEAHTVRQARYK